MLVCALCEFLFTAGGDVNAGAVGGQGLRAHEADAGAAAGDDGDPVFDVEELFGGEVVG